MILEDEFWDGVKQLWVVERHPKGAICIMPLVDTLERNYRRWTDHKKDPGWEMLSLHPTRETALDRMQNLKRKNKGETG